MDDYTQLGKLISFVLRHKPEAINISLDNNGWAEVSELIHGINSLGHKVDMQTLERIVETNDKMRYSFNIDKTKIRANQGHSIENTDIQLKTATPPEKLYHGTTERFFDSIMKNGLTKQSRNHVHLSENYETAVQVGKRHGKPLVLVVNAKSMYNSGYAFFLSENNVWLTERVPVEYILMRTAKI